ncbi:MAG TPA: hypothetical protein VD867_08025 [Burkholderiales bacterium]|nr:hypothetical protein [Burkholderiales bacterium]
MKLSRTIELAVVLAATAASVQVGLCQSIRIPDFREGPSIATGMPQGKCDDCGVVLSVREIYRRRDSPVERTGTPMGGANDRVIGAVIVVMPFGPGSADAKPMVGAVGTPDMQERMGELSYEVTLRMSDGSLRRFERREGRHYNAGDHVRVSDGRWQLLRSGS